MAGIHRLTRKSATVLTGSFSPLTDPLDIPNSITGIGVHSRSGETGLPTGLKKDWPYNVYAELYGSSCLSVFWQACYFCDLIPIDSS